MRKSLIIFLLLAATFGHAQLNCTVTVNSNKIANANPGTFKTLQKSISEFVNKTNWTGEDETEQDQRIECAMYITLNSYDSNQYTATIQVQSSRPVFNSTYSSPVFNYMDKDFSFSYVEFENLTYDPNSFSSNLVSVLSYYSFIMLGMDADTFAPEGGTKYLETAQDIVNISQQGGYKGWSQADGNQNRYFLINDMLSSTYAPFRQAMYEYHLQGLDKMADDAKAGKEGIAKAISTLAQLYSVRPNAFLTRVFFDAKADEIVQVFSGGPKITADALADNLGKLSPLNAAKWNSIKY
jgi:hypothetical protein